MQTPSINMAHGIATPSGESASDNAPRAFSRRRRVLFAAVAMGMGLVLALAGGEILLRLRGYRPWAIKQITWEVQPGGRFYQADAQLGFVLLPGEFTITWHPGFSFTATHLDPAITRTGWPLRATHPLASHDAATASVRPEIWIFGCSWTYGSRINDAESFPWLVQTAMTGHEVVNFGVSGYGTLHGLIQLREALEKRGRPEQVVFTYASFHDERNTFSRLRRKDVAPYCSLGPIVQPYARVEAGGELRIRMAETAYAELPLMRWSALAHAIEQQCDTWEDKSCRGPDVSLAIIREAEQLCRENNVRFLLAGMADDEATRKMIERYSGQGIECIDISVDRSIDANTLRPYDQHPSALANQQYAAKLLAGLTASIRASSFNISTSALGVTLSRLASRR